MCHNAYHEENSSSQNLFIAKDDEQELLLSYNEKREPIGIQPRIAFLNSTTAKVVVWAFVFTLDGKLLIHKREKNAKDNQGMWDKSVGGHVERSDIESATAIAREVAEELYTDEASIDYYKNLQVVKKIISKMKYLGEWSSADHINKHNFDDRSLFYYYRVNYDFSKQLIHSHRVLPNEEIVNVSFFADVFFFIAPHNFSTDNLCNSKYMLVELDELKKSCISGVISVANKNIEQHFSASPDLLTIIDSTLWKDLKYFEKEIKSI